MATHTETNTKVITRTRTRRLRPNSYPVTETERRGWNSNFLKKIRILIHFLEEREIAKRQKLCIIVCRSTNHSKYVEKEILRTGYSGDGCVQRYVRKHRHIIRERLRKKWRSILIMKIDDWEEKSLKGQGDYIIQWDYPWREKHANDEFLKRMMSPTGLLGNFPEELERDDWRFTQENLPLDSIILEMYRNEGPRTIRIVQAWVRKCVEAGSYLGADVEQLIAEYNRVIMLEWNTYEEVCEYAKKNKTGLGFPITWY